MDTMQAELGTQAALLGVNAVGYEAWNDSFTEGTTIPWLQDEAETLAWEAWEAEWRDVYVLTPEGRLWAVFDLNAHDLGVSEDYQELRALLLEAAGR